MSQKVNILGTEYHMEFQCIAENPYLKDGEFYTVLIKLINKDVGVEDFKQIGDLIMEYCRMSAKIAYNAI